MNWYTEFRDIVLTYLRSLNFNQNKTFSKGERDTRKRSSIVLFFGLEGQFYSNEEIAIILEITEERVRQIIKEGINDIHKIVFDQDNNSLFKSPNESILKLKVELFSKKVISYNGFLNQVSNQIDEKPELVKPILDLLIEVFEFKKMKTHLHHLRDNDLIFTSENFNSKNFIKLCYTTYLTLEKHVVPMDSKDLTIAVRRKYNSNSYSNNDILLACSVVDAISQFSESKFHINFERISSLHDMAFRILFENGERMKLAEILREINYRLHNTVKKPADKSSLNTQMNMDNRLVPLGKTGYWTLKEWNEVNKTMYDLISDTLILFNKPLTKKQIFDHIQKSRPKMPTRSLDTVIYNYRYLKVKGDKFILSEWRELYKDQIINTFVRNQFVKENPVTSQIKDQIVNLFLENNSTSIQLSTIVKTLNKNFKFPKASVYKIVSEEPIFLTELISKNKKIVMYKGKNISTTQPLKSTSIFVSYSWESEKHKDMVISFVDFLRNKGFEADMDIKFMQEETALDFNRLMHIGILKYDKVVVFLSESYKIKAESFEGGVGKEYKFIVGDIEKNPKKYILTSFQTITRELLEQIVPADLKGREVVDLVKDEQKNFEKLFSKLTDTGGYKFSDVAKNTPLVEQKYIKPFTLK